MVGRTAQGRAWAHNKSTHCQSVAWVLLPPYLEELEGLGLQGLRGQGGEGGVQPIFAITQHRVLPEGGICPKHSTKEQQQLPLRRDLTPDPHPYLDLWGRQRFNCPGHMGYAGFISREWSMQLFTAFSTLTRMAYRKVATALLVGL